MVIEFLIIFAVMILFMWFTTRSARKAQLAAQKAREEAIVIGTNVVTTAGFFGRIVDIDGDAITLESPSGDETVWLRSSIRGQMDIPLAQGDDALYAPETSVTGEDPIPADATRESNVVDSESPIKNDSPFEEPEGSQGSAWK